MDCCITCCCCSVTEFKLIEHLPLFGSMARVCVINFMIKVLSHIGIPNGRLCTGLLVLVRSQLDSSQHSREQRQQPQRHCRWAPQLPPSLLGLPSFPLAVSFPRIFGILFVLSTHCRIARACACSSFHISVLRRINTALHGPDYHRSYDRPSVVLTLPPTFPTTPPPSPFF